MVQEVILLPIPEQHVLLLLFAASSFPQSTSLAITSGGAPDRMVIQHIKFLQGPEPPGTAPPQAPTAWGCHLTFGNKWSCLGYITLHPWTCIPWKATPHIPKVDLQLCMISFLSKHLKYSRLCCSSVECSFYSVKPEMGCMPEDMSGETLLQLGADLEGAESAQMVLENRVRWRVTPHTISLSLLGNSTPEPRTSLLPGNVQTRGSEWATSSVVWRVPGPVQDFAPTLFNLAEVHMVSITCTTSLNKPSENKYISTSR